MDNKYCAQQILAIRRLISGRPQDGGGADERAHLHVDELGDHMDCNQRARYCLDVRRLFSGWNEIGGGGRWRDIHLAQFWTNMDTEHCSQQWLAVRRLFSGW